MAGMKVTSRTGQDQTGQGCAAHDLPDPFVCADRLERLAEAAGRLHLLLLKGPPERAHAMGSFPTYLNPDGSIEAYPMQTVDELIGASGEPDRTPPVAACGVPAPHAA